jgi:F-type H+-transporting ATPase subunit epsilon
MGELGHTSFRLEVMTPERPVISDEVSELMAPGAEGYFGVLPGHTPFITALSIGELTYRKGKDERHLAVTWGYAEVRGDRVIVLAETAERAEEIDVERAERARRRAEDRLQSWFGGDEEVDFARAQAALYRALNRVEVARKGH